jgi:predicted 3-demethylubiquinone-9 3-methyltransferase (glyoxalase superfamily)
MQKIKTFLWFDSQAEEAAEFYVSVFPNSRILQVTHYHASSKRAGQVLTVEFDLDGERIVALNGGPEFTLDEAFSLQVDCEDQAEIDHYWDALRAGGGQEGPCGWLKDRFGVSWQVVPKGMGELIADEEPERRDRVMEALMSMGKLDAAALRAAYDG